MGLLVVGDGVGLHEGLTVGDLVGGRVGAREGIGVPRLDRLMKVASNVV